MKMKILNKTGIYVIILIVTLFFILSTAGCGGNKPVAETRPEPVSNTSESPDVNKPGNLPDTPEADALNNASEIIYDFDPIGDETFIIWKGEEREKILNDLESAYDHMRREVAVEIVKALSPYVQKDTVIGDVGCGSGFFTLILSQMVPDGLVYAVDISYEAIVNLVYVRRNFKRRYDADGVYFDNIVPVLSYEDSLTLSPGRLDSAFMYDVHIFFYDLTNREQMPPPDDYVFGSDKEKRRVMQEIDEEYGAFIDDIHRTIKPGGNFFLLEKMRCSGPKVRLNEPFVIELMDRHGFEHEKTVTENMPEDMVFVIFKRK